MVPNPGGKSDAEHDVTPSLKPVHKDIHANLVMATPTEKKLPLAQLAVCTFVQTCIKNPNVAWDTPGCTLPFVKTFLEATHPRHYAKEVRTAALETAALVVARQRVDEAQKVEELGRMDKEGRLSKTESAELKVGWPGGVREAVEGGCAVASRRTHDTPPSHPPRRHAGAQTRIGTVQEFGQGIKGV